MTCTGKIKRDKKIEDLIYYVPTTISEIYSISGG